MLRISSDLSNEEKLLLEATSNPLFPSSTNCKIKIGNETYDSIVKCYLIEFWDRNIYKIMYCLNNVVITNNFLTLLTKNSIDISINRKRFYVDIREITGIDRTIYGNIKFIEY